MSDANRPFLRESEIVNPTFTTDVHYRRSLQLESMFGLAEDGRQDRLLSYTRPISGSFYYAPPMPALAAAFEG